MKATQKLKVDVEGIVNVVAFRDLDPSLKFIVAKLEREGDRFGAATEMVYNHKSGVALCVMISYADKSRDPVKPSIFGYDSDELLSKQYKD